jgi:acylpyruvate hydrolase
VINHKWRAGAEDNGLVLDLANLGFPSDLKKLLEAGTDDLGRALRYAREKLKGNVDHALHLADLELGPPIADPDKVLCLGLNYSDHAEEANVPLPKVPTIFAKFRNSLIESGGVIQLPAVSTEIDYEGKLAVVIGRRCARIAESEAQNYIAGYTIFNDVSARDLQLQISQRTIGKAVDSFGPIGPGLVPASLVVNPQNLQIITRVNGRVLQRARTSEMVFSVYYLVSYISRTMTLEPGDIIATGTPAGVGFTPKPPIYLRHRDVVEVEIEGLGILTNLVVAAAEDREIQVPERVVAEP